MKAAIVIYSDPQSRTDEALGRLFNGLATAWDFKEKGDEVTILFQGAGTRWISELDAPEHPARALFDSVKDKVAGVSCGCADVFGSRDEAESAGYELVTDNAVPGTSGLPSHRQLIADGYTLLSY